MERFKARVEQFEEHGDKTGWTYIVVPQDIAEKLKPGTKKSFRVKGKLDQHPISNVALIPMGAGNFLLAFNASMRKGTRKKKGAMVDVQLSFDPASVPVPAGFLESLEDEPEAKKYFDQLKLSQRNYFLRWIAGVKSEEAMAKRMALVIIAFNEKKDFGAMIRGHKGN